MSNRTVVIGGGAAGLMAAGRAAERGKNVILLEKNALLAKKVRITGKGRCNITNDADMEEFIRNVPTNGKFLYSAFYTFTNQDIIRLLHDLGVATKVERGGRVFPVSDSAKDVAEALKKYALHKNTDWVKTAAVGLRIQDGAVTGVRTKNGVIACGSAIVATGGKSYPLTGSTGDGYRFAENAGHTVIPPKPSLIPIVTRERWVTELMGLSLRNIGFLVLDEKGKKVYSDFGELLFTHFGISGPVVLPASAHMRRPQAYKMLIDLKPALSHEQLDKRILRDFEAQHKKHLVNALDLLLPKALIPVIIKLLQFDPHMEVNAVTKVQREQLCRLLKAFPLTAAGFRPIEEAIITSGGVKTSEINPSTMESKLVKGLYFAGEVIDVDAYTGGYNLQIAFSTGYLAGDSV
ncbi:MAG TPA: NAD(P)/FAD-dependent oxidoreductase [Candidatus Avimonoglobus intestinipullorum]|uniref:NAD(P)/FAD-dependent oxidoreductase n=1 Tax=Candidatus Avimonoglobus intestinipullorum TaxID=2840699 RepID=A0A9D1S6K5_9FIRM|nr:NAD(P)/FAD-dependent oxidoreductase [Candidatus Avimonoglobus intestinipullorum]